MQSENGNSNGNGNGRATFAEVRRMARWMGLFTASMLAEALHVHHDVGAAYVQALQWHRLADDTGTELPGDDGEDEPVLEMQPLPERHLPRPRHTPPHIVAVMQMGGPLLFDRRGEPVRLVNDAERRRAGSKPGEGHKMKQREKRYQKMQDAKEKRARQQREKAKQQ